MLKTIILTYTAAVLSIALLSIGPARSQSVFEMCSGDIKSHCATVLPGDGRLYACLYAHEEKISEACDEVTADVADQLDLLFELVGYTKFQCRADIKKHCSGVEMGGGQILSCLQGKSGSLAGDCAEVVNRLSAVD